MPPSPTSLKSYDVRSRTHPTPVGRHLLTIVSLKKTNLCISLDLDSPAAIVSLLSRIGPYICCAKTHIDTLPFTSVTDLFSFLTALQALSEEHNFLIFEDRKFADIGNTAKAQYGSGIYRIVEWAHITNAHSVAGPAIIDAMRECAKEAKLDRGLLLLAEMSSKGTLAEGEYARKTVQMARERGRGFVMGFIGQRAVETDEEEGKEEDWIVMTPGVNMASTGDALGQQYRTPEIVVKDEGCDIIIVGRGIFAAEDPVKEAVRYRDAGWAAYEARIRVGSRKGSNY